MRENIVHQLSLVPSIIDHDHARELQRMSEILSRLPMAARLVAKDLNIGLSSPTTGREGMTAEQVLRAMVVKHMNGFSYAQLAFHLADSATYRRFCLFGFAESVPKRSTLHQNIKRIKASSWEAINRLLVAEARRCRVEDGKTVRIDSTVIETNIHHPLDSALLYDCVRTLVRLMKRGQAFVSSKFHNHRRVAKRRSMAIANAKRTKDRIPLYRQLVTITEQTVQYAQSMLRALRRSQCPDRQDLADRMEQLLRLARRVIDQAKRRVFDGESVPATEKVVSIFEPHTDVIRKGGRDTLYGHKAFLSVGVSGMVLDLTIENGNPTDSSRAANLLERHIEHFGSAPLQATFDAGFTTNETLKQAQLLGVRDAAFSKRHGVDVMSAVSSTWLYRRLQRLRAGIEGIISFLKRCFGFDRCSYRGRDSFDAYAHSAVVSANLLLLARHTL